MNIVSIKRARIAFATNNVTSYIPTLYTASGHILS